MNALGPALDDYLAIRRSLGFKLREHGLLLPDLVDFLVRAGATTVSTELALAWAMKPAGAQPYRWRQRLSLARGFARHLWASDASVEVPAADLLAYRHRRPTPYLYRDAEIVALLDATGRLRPPHRAATHRALLGLLAATGMRLGEGIGLDRADVDLDAGSLHVRQGKLGGSRSLPLRASTVEALRDHARERDRLCRRPPGASFFVTTTGTRLIDTSVRTVFRELVRHVGPEPRDGSGWPRIHDLRHSFAVATLRDWYRAGVDVAERLPLLSAYLGHASPASTYWYLQATPELLAAAADRLERHLGARP